MVIKTCSRKADHLAMVDNGTMRSAATRWNMPSVTVWSVFQIQSHKNKNVELLQLTNTHVYNLFTYIFDGHS